MNRKFGKTIAKFIYNKLSLIKKKCNKVSAGQKVHLNKRSIRGVKFIRGSETKKNETYYEEIILKHEKESIYDEVVLSGDQKQLFKKILILDIRSLQKKMMKQQQNSCNAIL